MITSFIDIHTKFESRKDNPIYNTSYPLSPNDWAEYKVEGQLTFDCAKPIAFYLHIPFCRQLCRFCEYTRMRVPSDDEQMQYVRTLVNDITRFCSNYPNLSLYGLDIGGGTPTALTDKAFTFLLNAVQKIIKNSRLSVDFEPSIEATFQTLSVDKIEQIAASGIKRISLGLQSSSSAVLNPMQRQSVKTEEMAEILNSIHNAGIAKVNLDLMYGLPNQSHESISRDLECIHFLNPEQVTLYELRTNQLVGISPVSQERNYQYYKTLYDGLIKLGYIGTFGQNTFSKDSCDQGLSSYLRHRMYEGWQYRGFGVSAQSMSDYGLSYNIGKNSKDLRNILTYPIFDADTFYKLPPHQLLNKYLAISGYSGGFSLDTAERIYCSGFLSDFQRVLQYLLERKFITCSRSRVQLTPEGFRHYGAVLSLFY